ncbi:hypothetical protein QBC47DRAFT_389134 [Echria macrotheca]|uniref:Uncharacterized protein n=1 Tax=Echria macrotheca TaxID=438768 RepID=A0AAJ0B8G9_9PEZI|nr:hypothetical protein QBC47DRAFT_389134 [Echria macrotheca]
MKRGKGAWRQGLPFLGHVIGILVWGKGGYIFWGNNINMLGNRHCYMWDSRVIGSSGCIMSKGKNWTRICLYWEVNYYVVS